MMKMNVVAFVGKVKEMPVLKESNAGNKFATMIMELTVTFKTVMEPLIQIRYL